MLENSYVKIDDSLAKWAMLKSNLYRRHVEAGQHKLELLGSLELAHVWV